MFQGALGQDLRSDGILAVHVAEEMHDVLGTGQQRKVSLDDDTVKTVIYKNQEAFQKLHEGFPSVAASEVWLATKIICLGDRWNQPGLR